MGDSARLRGLAWAHRDTGVPEADYDDYAAASARDWGGPPPRWFAEAMHSYPERFGTSHRGRVALVTGGVGGIGLYAAMLLAAVGFTIILPPRPGLAHEARGARRAIQASVPDATVLLPAVGLDLASFRSVREFGAHLRSARSTYPRIDALLLNAGRGGGVHDAHEQTEDGLEAIMQARRQQPSPAPPPSLAAVPRRQPAAACSGRTAARPHGHTAARPPALREQVNLLSHALLTHELLPLLRTSPHARVCLHSSSARHNVRPADLADLLGARRALDPWGRYSLSKAGLCLLARGLNARLKGAQPRVEACVADPGLAATGVNVQHDLARSLGLTRRGVADTVAFHDQAAVHAADGALPLVLAALSGGADELFAGHGARATSLGGAAARTAVRAGDPMAWDAAAVEELWRDVAKATGLSREWLLDAGGANGVKSEL